jgi:glycerophosphoryl diester phosphodiesterase
MRSLCYSCLLVLLVQCETQPVNPALFHIHGHRGCRGLRPENTIPAFIHAMEWGVDALEMDVVITGDHHVLVSHEPEMLAVIMAYPDGRVAESMGENIFTMSTAEAQSYRCGTHPHPRFPEQICIPSFKPLLLEVVDSVRQYAHTASILEPLYNIELKTIYEQDSSGKWNIGDHKYHPDPENFVRIFLNEIAPLQIKNNLVIQSFDARILEAMHQQSPDIPLVYLSEDSLKSPEVKLRELSFKPHGYSIYYPMINTQVVDYCRLHGIQLLAWTVNEPHDIERLVLMGVSEIITDYPDRALAIRKRLTDS